MDNINIDIIEVPQDITIAITETPNIVTIVETGTRGPQGLQGTSGCGVPTGGSAGYLLVKKSGADYDTKWVIQDEDIQQYPSISNFPPIGEDSILYIDLSNHTSWVWDGSATIPTYIGVGGLGSLPVGPWKSIAFNDDGQRNGDINFLYDKNLKSVIINKATILPSNPLAIGGEYDSYLQVNLQNTNGSGIHASSDFVLTADNGSDSTNYIDLGINNSSFNDPAFPYAEKNDGYLISVAKNLVLGAINEDQKITFFAGSDTIQSAEITGSGMEIPMGSSYKVNGFDVMDVISSASSAAMESSLFASGARIVIRTDLL